MKPKYHVMVSASVAGALYAATRSADLSLSCLIAGVFIDLDHVPDYMREYGNPLRIREFFLRFRRGEFDRIYLLLHGWEWIALLAVISWLSGWNHLITGTTIGMAQHILLDTFNGSITFRAYSLYWRWRQGFRYATIFRGRQQAVGSKQ
jgi:hypothetical protein